MNDSVNFQNKCVNTIRFLATDAIEKAKSGHPGMPMGAAPMAYALWMRHLKHNPKNPKWPNRDRFILSAGHASMLLYTLLHLTGYDLSLEDIKAFRQWGSRTPGHPEFPHTPGAEVTTGPLGQGISNAVGMAIAEAHLSARFNRPGHVIVDHYTYVLASDGDLMEGVAFEACAIAGHLGLGKLIVLYDNNHVSLAGSTSLTFSEDVQTRFTACGWQVLHVEQGNDIDAIDKAIEEARNDTLRPSLVSIRTTIGYGAPSKEGTADAHGSPLGKEELMSAKTRLGWPLEPDFHIPGDVLEHYRASVFKGETAEGKWKEIFAEYGKEYGDQASEFERMTRGDLPSNWDLILPTLGLERKPSATRKSGEAILQELAGILPELIGGSADLNPSTFTWLKGFGDFQNPDRPHEGVQGRVGGDWGYSGRNIHFGVREHAMGAIAVGIALHGALIPYTATFFTFADYMRPPIRLAALMGLRILFVFTHDSIGLGEDGPTHQPVEHLMSLRVMPNLTVIRPADAAETVEAWRTALLNTSGPTALVLTRQNVSALNRETLAPATGLRQGGYILRDPEGGNPEIILIGTGSEVEIALAAADTLAAEGKRVRVVSLPCWEIFDAQPAAYREKVLPEHIKLRVAVEAGIRLGWEHYVGTEGKIIGLDSFGASAPSPILFERFGITADALVHAAKELLR
ncbi:MAG: transketolase [Syntrophales bacterium]|jgi:transketolase|nr:transketolase [Syntrophales bacterium]